MRKYYAIEHYLQLTYKVSGSNDTYEGDVPYSTTAWRELIPLDCDVLKFEQGVIDKCAEIDAAVGCIVCSNGVWNLDGNEFKFDRMVKENAHLTMTREDSVRTAFEKMLYNRSKRLQIHPHCKSGNDILITNAVMRTRAVMHT